ncbi:unnamed protein product [Ectocarpus sp. 12 AP-2014]
MAKSKSKESHRGREREKSSKKRRREKEESSTSAERQKKKKSKDSKHSSSRSRNDRRSERGGDRKKKSSSSSHSSSSKSKGKKTMKERKGDATEEGNGKQSIQAEIQISEKDYFIRAVEFKVWLCHKKKKFFEDLTSDESHELFDKFIKDWNRGKLDPHFYEGRLPDELIARTKKTQHKWGFVNRLSDRDQMQLELANDSVHSSTEKVKGATSNVPVLPVGSAATAPGVVVGKQADGRGGDGNGRGGGGGGGGSRSGSGRRTEAKRQRRQEREKHAVVLDEIAPKETGRQAVLDKRRVVGARTHAAAKEREDAADGLDMKESDTMGGSDSFRETLARTQHGKQRRQMAKTEHLQGLAAKEEEKRAAFMAQMGLKAGQKITIQPRRDG